LLIDAGHADQGHSQVAAVEEVAELFQASGAEPVGFVDDDHFGAVDGSQLVPRGMAGRSSERSMSAPSAGCGQEQFQEAVKFSV
jgi:hypothetical protein